MQLEQAVYEGNASRGGRREIFVWIQRGTLGLLILLVVAVAIAQPALWERAAFAIAGLAVIWLGSHHFASKDDIRAASWVLVLGLVTLIGLVALRSGGVESPGVRSYLVVVLIAGVLLGERDAISIAMLCAAIALGLAVAGEAGRLPATTAYRPLAVWLLLCAYIVITVFVMRLFARSVTATLDRTKLLLAEREAALAKLDTVLKVGAIGVWSFDPASRSYRGDATLHSMLGSAAQPSDEVAEQEWLALVHPDDLDLVVRSRDAASRSGTTSVIDIRLTDQRGELRELEVTLMPDPESKGELRVVTGLVMDRTEARRAVRDRLAAASALRERVKELELLHQAARLLSPDRPYSPAVLRDLAERIPGGFQRPEATVACVSYGEDLACSPGFAVSEFEMTIPLRTSQGSGQIVVSLLAGPSGGDRAFLAEERQLLVTLGDMLESYIERDVAEQRRKAVERQLRQAGKLEALGTLAGGIAHDFNNILTAIGSNNTLAKSEVSPGSVAAKALGELERAHVRARDLVRRILLFSKQGHSERRRVDVAEILHDVSLLVRSTVPSGVTLEVALPDGLPALHADATQVHQAVLNLVTNAAHALRGAPAGSVRVTATPHTESAQRAVTGGSMPPGEYVRLDVSDTGPGIAANVLDRIFDPFFTTKGSEGTGLGLAVVYGVMQEHGGAVTVESTLGAGTTFSLFFPASAEVAREARAEVVSARGRGERILYVDDEEAITYAMSKLLPAMGYVCETYTDPAAALHAFREDSRRFDIAIVDMSMPGILGNEVAKELTRLRPHFPVVICSGYSGEVVPVGADSGVAAAIPKPVELPELSRLISSLLRRD